MGATTDLVVSAMAACALGVGSCAPRAPGPADRTGSVLQSDASPTDAAPRYASAPPAALGATPGLPPLPAPSVAVTTTPYVLATPEPPTPCPPETGWDGKACASTNCPGRATFVKGSGCMRCFGECGPRPEWAERRPWGNSATPFDHDAASAALAAVDISNCKRSGGPTGVGFAEVTFVPTGEVDHVVADGKGFTGTAVADCIEKRFKTVRVPGFGGGPVTVSRTVRLE